MKKEAIDYLKIGKAQRFYEKRGYENVKTGWIVSNEAILVTLPPERRMQRALDGSLVASGEQGFIQMMMDGTMKVGRYQTATPCFRDEPAYSETTLPWFFKVELIDYLGTLESARAIAHKRSCDVLHDAFQCMEDLAEENFEVVMTPEGFDIMCNGIELGSYGYRTWENHLWVYGTGIAEPRFSIAVGDV
jgi:hypothetical protein